MMFQHTIFVQVLCDFVQRAAPTEVTLSTALDRLEGKWTIKGR